MRGDLRELRVKHCRSNRGAPFYLTSGDPLIDGEQPINAPIEAWQLDGMRSKGMLVSARAHETKKKPLGSDLNAVHLRATTPFALNLSKGRGSASRLRQAQPERLSGQYWVRSQYC